MLLLFFFFFSRLFMNILISGTIVKVTRSPILLSVLIVTNPIEKRLIELLIDCLV